MTLVNFNNRTKNAAPYFNNVFDSLFSEAINKNLTVATVPGVNILETAENFQVEVAAPGLKKEDFQISLEKDTLTISAAYKAEGAQQKYSRREYDFRNFKRSFILPDSVEVEKISATYVDGILTLSLGKKDETKIMNREIKVS